MSTEEDAPNRKYRKLDKENCKDNLFILNSSLDETSGAVAKAWSSRKDFSNGLLTQCLSYKVI